jgi:hypothetical protein
MKSSRKLPLLVLLALSVSAVGQKKVTDFLEMGKDAAGIMTKEYLRPYGEMLGKSLNGGWYNSASIHKLGGFDLTVGVNMVMAPPSAESFDVAGLINTLPGNWSLEDPSVSKAPTAAGSFSTRPVLVNEDLAKEIALPNGSGYNVFPMPIAQVSVGLPGHTEVSARFVPKMSVGNAGKVNLYGFGLTHSFKEYVPILKRFPIWQASVMAAYTHFGSEVNVDSYEGGTDQSLEIDANGFTGRFLLGIKVPVLELYTGVGYGSTTSDFALKGNYGPLGSNPIALAYKEKGLDFNAGLKLQLGFLALYGDYTFGDYSMLSAGLGISFR